MGCRVRFAAVTLVAALGLTACGGELDPPAPLPTPSPSPPGTVPAPPPVPPPAQAPTGAPWSDPATWGGTVPAPGADVTVDKPVLLDTDAAVASLTVTETGVLAFDPAASRTLESSGNVVVRGQLDARPAAAAVVHTLRFTGVDETRFQGTVMEPVPGDVGLWVMDAGRLIIEGAAKTAWTTAMGDVPAGTTTITVGDAGGWQVGDEITIAPTAAGRTGEADYDTAAITAIAGNTITLSTPTANAHPAVAIPANPGKPAYTATAEVLNLTRNVRIEGTPSDDPADPARGGHRAHILVHNTVPTAQIVKNAALRHLGPRQATGELDYTELVMGRYALHFHISGSNNVGSEVSGVVGRDIGSHVFVAHEADGIAFTDNVSHNTFDEAYWWDGAPDTRTAGPPTDDILYERNVASLVRSDPSVRGYRLAGFSIGRGTGNVARGNVAVGVQGTSTSSGFIWPEGSEGLWTFEDNVAHNNATHGIFTWQNTGTVHVINRFTGYHNEGSGISHGAYGNPYRYENSTLYGNAAGAVELHAVSNGGTLTLSRMTMDGAGRSDYLVTTARHYSGFDSAPPTLITQCRLLGAKRAGVAALYTPDVNGDTAPESIDLVDNTFEGNPFWINSGVLPSSRIRIRDAVHGSIELAPAGLASFGGAFNAAWNANARPIPPF